jgi:hypothetical protein
MADQREYEITNLFLLWLSVWYFIYLTDIDRLLNPLSTRNSTLYLELISFTYSEMIDIDYDLNFNLN